MVTFEKDFVKLAVATIADSRDDYYKIREPLLLEEQAKTLFLEDWSKVLRSEVLRSVEAAGAFAREAAAFGAECMIIHIPIWADPELSLVLAQGFDAPILLLGNKRGVTSSVVGTLGSGGGLDQFGIPHVRVFGCDAPQQAQLRAFAAAAHARAALRGGRMLRFGGRSLGIVTADPVEELWEKDFGLSVLDLDQREIVDTAQAMDPAEVERCRRWITDNARVELDEVFTAKAFDKQVRSYLATEALIEKYGGRFIGVKCQKELSDGYVVQCLAHSLINGTQSMNGKKPAVPFACEADANGAVTMYILNLLSGGKPATLLDIRELNGDAGVLTLANCGGTAVDLMAQEGARDLEGLTLCRHTFGAGCGGGCHAKLRQGRVTLARLSVKNGRHSMTVIAGEVVDMPEEVRASIPYTFPCARIKTALDDSFLQSYDSNHVHLVYGDYVDSLREFCRMCGVACTVYQ